MLTMSTKQKSDHESRIQTMSIPALTEGIVMLRLKLNRMKVKHRGRKLKDGPLVNAVFAWLFSLDEAEQLRIAQEGLRLFEAMLEGDIAPSVAEPDWLAGKSAPGLPGSVAEKGGKPKRVHPAVKRGH